MKEGYRHLIVIVDESGSMNGVKSDTIGGMKSFISSQRDDADIGTITTVFFEGGNIKKVHDFADLKALDLSSVDVYLPKGMTNLLDAMGTAITQDGGKIAEMSEDDRPEKVIVCVLTDGLENSSNEYTQERIKEMVKEQEEKYSWDFNFISADLSALTQAQDYGFQSGKMAHYGKENTEATFKAMSSKVSRSAEGGDEAFLSCELGAMID